MDASLFKNFALGERLKMQFEFKFYNIFNHVNLANPNHCVDCSNGGSISSLVPGAQMRSIEFGGKITF